MHQISSFIQDVECGKLTLFNHIVYPKVIDCYTLVHSFIQCFMTPLSFRLIGTSLTSSRFPFSPHFPFISFPHPLFHFHYHIPLLQPHCFIKAYSSFFTLSLHSIALIIPSLEKPPLSCRRANQKRKEELLK
jgi:hypothetical protein